MFQKIVILDGLHVVDDTLLRLNRISDALVVLPPGDPKDEHEKLQRAQAADALGRRTRLRTARAQRIIGTVGHRQFI